RTRGGPQKAIEQWKVRACAESGRGPFDTRTRLTSLEKLKQDARKPGRDAQEGHEIPVLTKIENLQCHHPVSSRFYFLNFQCARAERWRGLPGFRPAC